MPGFDPADVFKASVHILLPVKVVMGDNRLNADSFRQGTSMAPTLEGLGSAVPLVIMEEPFFNESVWMVIFFGSMAQHFFPAYVRNPREYARKAGYQVHIYSKASGLRHL
jgi:hypothetical protein